MTIINILRAVVARLAKAVSVPGEREALDAHLAKSASVSDVEARMHAWEQRSQGSGYPF